MSSNSVRSFIKPALHVGEQIDAGLGCLACAGNGGTAGGATTAGGKLGDTLAQALTSRGSSVSISARLSDLGLVFIGDILHGGRPAALGFARLGLGLARPALKPADRLGVRAARLGVRAPLLGEPVGLKAGRSQREQQRNARELGDGPRGELGDHGIVTRPTSTIAAAMYPRTHSAAAHVSRTSSPRTT